jgi:flagella basal body P-ring formation protein FlgA
MNRCGLTLGLLCASVVVCGTSRAGAAQLQLRSECQCRGTMVTLGDVADITATDPKQVEALAAVELFPSPPAGTKRFVRLREIQDLLLIREIHLTEHEFSGASQVTVGSSGGSSPNPDQRPLTLAYTKKSERRVTEAIVRYLRERVSNRQSWTAQVTLEAREARLLSTADSVAVQGGQAPWTGSQRFQVTVGTSAGTTSFEVNTQIGVAAAVVVATRPLARGALITAADVELQAAESANGEGGTFHSLDEVLGKEVSQMIPAGKSLGPESLRAPLLVRRGEVVTVYARSAGVRVRTVARARDEGGLGELIAVESLESRKPFFARVSGVQEVEVYAQATRAAGNGVLAGRGN